MEIQSTQFLVGLNDSYSRIRSTILVKTPLPPISKVVQLLHQDEQLRQCSATANNVPLVDSSTALYAKPGPRFTTKKHGSKSHLLCEHCGGIGHVKDTCFFVHGFPEWHKLHGNKPDLAKMPKNLKGRSTIVSAHSVHSQPLLHTPGVEESSSKTMEISKDHYKHLISLIQDTSTSTSAAVTGNVVTCS